MWNGTAATLKPNPTSSSPSPISNIALCCRPSVAICTPIRVRFVVAVAPYTSAMPYSRKPEANAPNRKYLSAASAPAALAAAREHVQRDRHELEAEEQHHQILGAGHQHHPQAGEEQQREVLGHPQLLALEVVERDEHRERGRAEEQPVGHEPEVVHRDHGRDARRPGGLPPQEPGGEAGGAEPG